MERAGGGSLPSGSTWSPGEVLVYEGQGSPWAGAPVGAPVTRARAEAMGEGIGVMCRGV